MLYLRVLSALVGIPVTIFVVWYGGLLLLFFIGVIIILGILEMVRLLNNLGARPSTTATIIGSLLLLVVTYIQDWQLLGVAFTTILLLHLLLIVTRYPRYTPNDGAAGIFATMYLSLLLYIYLISVLPDGRYWIYLLLLGTWASDTFAYFTGRALGKHKITPVLSPKKTWEGAIGGIIGTIITVYVYNLLVLPVELGVILLLGFFISISSQLGDLVESTLKRQAGIKDSGNLIPGHGGVLDRFDSMLLSAPLVYYIIVVFII